MNNTMGVGRMRAVGLSILVAAVAAALLASSPVAAGVADDYEPGPCIRNGGIGATPFSDVDASAFYATAVAWAFSNEIVEGTGPDRFSPNDNVTRGQFATMLHRSVCEPDPSGTPDFTDLRIGAYYLDAVAWLVGEKLTTGTSPGLFSPEAPLTRGELAAFLHRLVGTPDLAAPAGFADVDQARFFAAGIDWLTYRGVTTGTTDTTFSPERLITRGEVVTFLHRLNTIGDVPAHFETLLSGLTQPVGLAQNPATGTWFIAEKPGTLQRWSSGPTTEALSVSVSQGNEQGLLSLAFTPDGGLVYVSYTDPLGDSVVDEYEMLGDDLEIGTRREIIRVTQPASNHNGGHVVIGPDGYLYFGLGDGGGANDTYGNGQNLLSLLGSIIRIDPASPSGGREYGIPADNPFVGSIPGFDQIWLYGVRNPWRFSFDQAAGDLWVADVGQSAREEITRMSGTDPGKGDNLGWPLREGSIQTPDSVGGPEPAGHIGPVHDYDPPGAQSITGGFVYRGDDIPALEGTYLWADFYDPTLMGWRDPYGVESAAITSTGGMVTSFGQDSDGEVYLLTIEGEFRKLVAG